MQANKKGALYIGKNIAKIGRLVKSIQKAVVSLTKHVKNFFKKTIPNISVIVVFIAQKTSS